MFPRYLFKSSLLQVLGANIQTYVRVDLYRLAAYEVHFSTLNASDVVACQRGRIERSEVTKPKPTRDSRARLWTGYHRSNPHQTNLLVRFVEMGYGGARSEGIVF